MMDDSNFICTMEVTQPVCNLKRESSYLDKKTGEVKVFYKIKPPKLMEAYRHYFGYEPNSEALHDALIDVVVCLRVYCMSLEDSFDVCGTNPVITDYIMRISPPGYTCEPPIIEASKKSASRKSASKRSVSKRAPSVKAPKKQKLSTIIEEASIHSTVKEKTPTPKPKTPTPKTESFSVKSKSRTYRKKSTSKSKTRSKRKTEMSDFIVDDDII
jgi:DNA polymerase III epsilon subunit-like protein